MKKISAILALGLILSLTGCKDDLYTSVRHPENSGTEVADEVKPSESTDENKKEEENSDQRKVGEKEISDQVKEEIADGVEFRVEDTVNMRLAPSENSAIVAEVGPDDEILNLGETEGWTRVTVNGKTGYIRSDLLIKN